MPLSAGSITRTLHAPPLRPEGALALFLDMDGVLAALAPTPEAVVADMRRTAVLEALDEALEGRIAIISGRTISEIDRISGIVGLSASGIHGLQRRRRDGSVDHTDASPRVARAVDAFRKFAGSHPGTLVEDKGGSASLHYRQAPAAARAAMALAERLAGETGLDLQPGHMVLELKTPGADKGRALSAFMSEPPFLRATPVMVGDDLTDEAGFRVAETLGGYGILVGPMRETAARYGLPDVPAVLDWLEAVAAARA